MLRLPVQICVRLGRHCHFDTAGTFITHLRWALCLCRPTCPALHFP